MLHNSKQKELSRLVARYRRLGYTKTEAIEKAYYAYTMKL